jgi:hypothetical protein
MRSMNRFCELQYIFGNSVFQISKRARSKIQASRLRYLKHRPHMLDVTYLLNMINELEKGVLSCFNNNMPNLWEKRPTYP